MNLINLCFLNVNSRVWKWPIYSSLKVRKNNFRMNIIRQQEGHIVVRPQSLGWSAPYKSGRLRGSQEAMATNASSPSSGQRAEQGLRLS